MGTTIDAAITTDRMQNFLVEDRKFTSQSKNLGRSDQPSNAHILYSFTNDKDAVVMTIEKDCGVEPASVTFDFGTSKDATLFRKRGREIAKECGAEKAQIVEKQ